MSKKSASDCRGHPGSKRTLLKLAQRLPQWEKTLDPVVNLGQLRSIASLQLKS